MKVRRLYLENIGPFAEANLDFDHETGIPAPIVLITGENGTGKSIILDAIRQIFGNQFGQLERDIRRKGYESKAKIACNLEIANRNSRLEITNISRDGTRGSHSGLEKIPTKIRVGEILPEWIVDYWSSSLSNGSYTIKTLTVPEHNNFMLNALQGDQSKTNTTQLICHFDYLRDSRNKIERETGEVLYSLLEKIIEKSLLDGGYLNYVSRATYEPIVRQNGQDVSLANLSSGNAYLIQHLVSLLGKMHSVNYLRKTPLSEMTKTSGVLLIDEAENQLHPKWQKRFLPTIRELFPNLQIIATTHSPFIISSVSDAKLFVCQSRIDHCVVTDETAQYNNKPIDEILMSPLFEETQPFNEKISQLIEEREKAISKADFDKKQQIETELKRLNPDYFSYLDIDSLLAEVAG